MLGIGHGYNQRAVQVRYVAPVVRLASSSLWQNGGYAWVMGNNRRHACGCVIPASSLAAVVMLVKIVGSRSVRAVFFSPALVAVVWRFGRALQERHSALKMFVEHLQQSNMPQHPNLICECLLG